MKGGMSVIKNNRGRTNVYPYIPNSAPLTQKQIMEYIGVNDMCELYEEIPEHLKYKSSLDIPEAILDEFSLKKHTEKLLSRNKNCMDNINFLGAGCAQHYVPAVVDEITTRGEFLTCYGAESWGDHGKYQAFFEYNSMLAELLDTEVTSVPQYDGGQAIATALSMANRINGRTKVLLPELMNPQFKGIIENYMDSVQESKRIQIEYIAHDKVSGTIDMKDLKNKLDFNTAAVLIENPGFLGMLECNAGEIGNLVNEAGAEYIVYVDPISLGLLEAPANYGATITCGDLHSLGLHLSCGNGHAGFISTQGELRYLNEYKDFIYGLAEPEIEGEYVFGNMLINRTHYAQRSKGKEYTGTGANLWMISAAVYMALMGPKGMKEVGETIFYNSHYASKELSKIRGLRLLYSGAFFKEFVIDFNDCEKTVKEINKKLLERGIFGGYDLSREFPNLGQSSLYSVTEVITKNDIDALIAAMKEIVY